VRVVDEPYDGPSARALVAELDEDLSRRYGSGDPVQAHADEFAPPTGRFLVVYLDGDPVACAGVRLLEPGTAELKRMFVRQAARRRGVARTLLAACEEAASQLGYTRLWLETGVQQPEAIALYEAAGYQPVPRFGQYKDSPSSRYYGIHLPSRR
jgi:GNAT superfamily N-acetyltransferase